MMKVTRQSKYFYRFLTLCGDGKYSVHVAMFTM